MVLRNRDGEYRTGSKAGLLSFLWGELGIGSSEKGEVRSVSADIELIASVPFCLGTDTGEEDSGGVPWVFSTFDLDRFDERIDPAGWDYAQYLKNPVVEWAHRYDIPAIGRADGIYTDEKGLHGSVVFNDKDYDPFGWAIGERVRHGVIRAGSVGFRVLEIELLTRKGVGRSEKGEVEDGTDLIFRKQELLEFSICNVPANPFALADKAAGSVGFRVLEIELLTRKGVGRSEKGEVEDGTALIFRRQELLEFSICNVPANPFALADKAAGSLGREGIAGFWGGIISEK
jgi:HK97 family phage prohead protease